MVVQILHDGVGALVMGERANLLAGTRQIHLIGLLPAGGSAGCRVPAIITGTTARCDTFDTFD
jgi:hypothetical protein